MSKGESYEEFTEKFKPKLTTDDCYTPPEVYEAVKRYAVETCGISADAPIIRPFYPGGDYEHADYPEGCVVIDNPPFSILTQIIDFYIARSISFYLFSPSLTLFSYASRPEVTCVCAACSIIYENGAMVCTSFVTNIYPDNPIAVIDGRLNTIIKDVQKKGKAKKVSRPVIKFPDNVINSALMNKVCERGVSFTVPREEALFIRRLDCGKNIFGAGLLLSDRMAAERMAAERMAVQEREIYELSEREKETVRSLGKRQPTHIV